MNVTSDYTPKVTLLTAHSSFDATSFVSLLEQNSFEVITQDLLLEDIDPEAEVAILFAPGQDLDEDQLKKLDAFLDNDGQKGRSLLYFPACHARYGSIPQRVGHRDGRCYRLRDRLQPYL